MRVLGLLSFFDERPEHLTAAVTSLVEAGVDHLVAVDGAFALFPDGTAMSSPEQHDAIRDAASPVGLTLHAPAGVWAGNEIEKRTLLFKLGHALAEPYDDWLFVLDADETITSFGEWRASLERTEFDVAAVLHGEPSVRPRCERRLFRAHPGGIRVERAHFYYRDGDDRVLWGPQQIDRVLLDDVVILHQPSARDGERNERRNRYYEERLLAHAELEV